MLTGALPDRQSLHRRVPCGPVDDNLAELRSSASESFGRPFSCRTECLDHVFIFNERHLATVLAEYVGYFNHWRPHRSIGQRAPWQR